MNKPIFLTVSYLNMPIRCNIKKDAPYTRSIDDIKIPYEIINIFGISFKLTRATVSIIIIIIALSYNIHS